MQWSPRVLLAFEMQSYYDKLGIPAFARAGDMRDWAEGTTWHIADRDEAANSGCFDRALSLVTKEIEP